jgi:hypothetical protein
MERYKKVNKITENPKNAKANIKIVEKSKSTSLTHKYLTAHFSVLVQTLQLKVAGLSLPSQ